MNLKKERRPPYENVGDYFRNSSPKMAQEVYSYLVRNPDGKAPFKNACLAVAEKTGMKQETIKRYATRYREQLEEVVISREKIISSYQELVLRIIGFPDDIQEKIGELPASKVLKILRLNEIDGTCPAWLVSCVRAHSGNPEQLLVELQAASDKAFELLSPKRS